MQAPTTSVLLPFAFSCSVFCKQINMMNDDNLADVILANRRGKTIIIMSTYHHPHHHRRYKCGEGFSVSVTQNAGGR